MPERIQLRRTRGYRKPPGAVNVARPTKWGNPFFIGKGEFPWANDPDTYCPDIPAAERQRLAAEWVVAAYRSYIEAGCLIITEGAEVTVWESPVCVSDVKRHLRGKDLACWCPIGDDVPCHAAVLLELANA